MIENRAKNNSNIKKIFLLILLSIGLTSLSYGDGFDGFFDDWTDEHLCGWMDKPLPPPYMVVEVNKRRISCLGGKVVARDVRVIVEIIKDSEVIEELEQVTSSDEDVGLGISAAREGDYNLAIDYLFSSILKNPNNAIAHYLLGKSLYKIGLNSEAEQNYRKALELNPNSSQVHNSLGLLYSSQGLYSKSIESFAAAISLNQNYSLPYINRGVIFFNKGSYQKALFDFTRAIEIEPNSSKAWLNRANVYYAIGAKDAVCEDLNKLCSLGNCTSLENMETNGYCKY
tara:strand:+ start:27 stop:881 length:855 start_codon:yes stop_codon:yes gene_type:complete